MVVRDLLELRAAQRLCAAEAVQCDLVRAQRRVERPHQLASHCVVARPRARDQRVGAGGTERPAKSLDLLASASRSGAGVARREDDEAYLVQIEAGDLVGREDAA